MIIYNKPNRPVEFMVIHCSDSEVASHDNIETIRGWHIQRGFSDIGYHYYINKAGEVFEGRPLNKKPASQYPFNKYSISICLGGRHSFADAQFEKLRELCDEIQSHYYCILPIFAHNRLNDKKTCPNFLLSDVLNIDNMGFPKYNNFKTILIN